MRAPRRLALQLAGAALGAYERRTSSYVLISRSFARALLVLGDVTSGEVAKAHAVHAQVVALELQRVAVGVRVAHHGAHVV